MVTVLEWVCFHSLMWLFGGLFQSDNLGPSVIFHVKGFFVLFGNLICLLIFKGGIAKSWLETQRFGDDLLTVNFTER